MTHQHILGYTLSYTLYDLHTMDSRQIKKTDERLQKLSTTQKKEQHKMKQNYPGCGLLPHSDRKRSGLILQLPSPHDLTFQLYYVCLSSTVALETTYNTSRPVPSTWKSP